MDLKAKLAALFQKKQAYLDKKAVAEQALTEEQSAFDEYLEEGSKLAKEFEEMEFDGLSVGGIEFKLKEEVFDLEIDKTKREELRKAGTELGFKAFTEMINSQGIKKWVAELQDKSKIPEFIKYKIRKFVKAGRGRY